MAAALFAFVAALIAGIGARDQVLVAALVARQGRHLGLLAVVLGSTWITTFIAAFAAATLAGELNARAGMLLAALALALAALELAILQPRRSLAEPTRSLGAGALVLFVTQLTDATRFLIFAIAIATHVPKAALLGGALGSALVVAAGWLMGEELLALRLKRLRRVLAALLTLVAAWLVWQVAMP